MNAMYIALGAAIAWTLFWVVRLFNAKENRGVSADLSLFKPAISEKEIRLREVKIGDLITIYHKYAKYNFCTGEVINNLPTERKMLIGIRWREYERGPVIEKKYILRYDGEELADFVLLNPTTSDEEPDQYDIASLQDQMNKALDKEDYELANRLQQQIDKLCKS